MPHITHPLQLNQIHIPRLPRKPPLVTVLWVYNQENIPANRQESPHKDFDLAGEKLPPASKRRLVMSLYGHDGGASTSISSTVEPGLDLTGVGVTLQSAALSNTEVTTAVMQSSLSGSVRPNTTQPMCILTEKRVRDTVYYHEWPGSDHSQWIELFSYTHW